MPMQEAHIAYTWANVFSCTIFLKLIMYALCKQITLYSIEKIVVINDFQ